MAKWPSLRPLHHWTTIEGVAFQFYKMANRDALISNVARIVLKGSGDIWYVSLDSQEVCGATFQRCFSTASDAVRQALNRLRPQAQPK
jgi:hypothetical protein